MKEANIEILEEEILILKEKANDLTSQNELLKNQLAELSKGNTISCDINSKKEYENLKNEIRENKKDFQSIILQLKEKNQSLTEKVNFY